MTMDRKTHLLNEEYLDTKLKRPGYRLDLDELNSNNINVFRRLNSVIFPVKYKESFYKDALSAHEYSRLAFFNDLPVGGMSCRLENPEDDGEIGLYIMTLGVLAPYRRIGLGALMLKKIFDQAKLDKVNFIYLHVQTSNEDAKSFYEKFGFKVDQVIDDYYKNINGAKSAWLLKYYMVQYNENKLS